MEFLCPVESVVDQVGRNLDTTEIVDRGVPVRMEALTRIGMFVKRRAIEMAKAVGIRRKVRRHPVQDHAEADLVAAVDEAGEAFRLAKAGARGIEARRLVAPGRVVGCSVTGRNSIW